MPKGWSNRKPRRLKIMEGTLRKDRDGNNGVAVDAAAPKKPTGLSKVASNKWDALVPALVELGVLTELDGDMVESYCRAYSRYIQANKRLDAMGKDADPGVVRKAEISIEKAEGSLRTLANELGMTPHSRARLDLEGDPFDDDPMADLLSR